MVEFLNSVSDVVQPVVTGLMVLYLVVWLRMRQVRKARDDLR